MGNLNDLKYSQLTLSILVFDHVFGHVGQR
jgi:hypothetical protein